jgi:signal transduction histidine kinase
MGMRERVQALGGTLDITGEPGRGVQVRAMIPVSKSLRKQRAEAH